MERINREKEVIESERGKGRGEQTQFNQWKKITAMASWL